MTDPYVQVVVVHNHQVDLAYISPDIAELNVYLDDTSRLYRKLYTKLNLDAEYHYCAWIRLNKDAPGRSYLCSRAVDYATWIGAIKRYVKRNANITIVRMDAPDSICMIDIEPGDIMLSDLKLYYSAELKRQIT